MQVYCGTSGYSYRAWKGPFYPPELPGKAMLSYYSDRLPAVEINNTFYRMPSAAVLEAWSAQVPAQFRFVLKAPRAITHVKPLKDKSAGLDYLFQKAATLGERLGAVLFQLPPYLRRDAALLADFTARLPSGMRCVFEFRHPSWFEEEIYELLKAKGSALCCADTEDEALLRLVATTDWGYLRLRKADYTRHGLQSWIDRINAQKWRTVYVFFKHEDAGVGPRLALRFLELAAQAGASGGSAT